MKISCLTFTRVNCLMTAFLASTFSGAIAGTLRFDQFYADNAVLQREVVLPVSGSADPGASVTIDFAGSSACAKADAKGRWRVQLPAKSAGGPYVLKATTGTETVAATNVFVGEVWLVSGQSNAYYPLERFKSKTQEWLKDADYPLVRFLEISWQQPHDRHHDLWQTVSPATAAKCSATGFFFAKNLQRDLKIPVGIIVAAVDGSIIQSWLSPEAYAKVHGSDEALEKQHQAEKLWRDYWAEIERRKKLSAEELKTLGELVRPEYPARYFSGHYHTFIEPIIPFPLKGVIWYQGESNGMFSQGYIYRFFLREMIRDWRGRWNAELPFLVVQLPHWKHSRLWADIRESQLIVAAAEPGVYIVPTFDIGDMKDIHPPKKPELGERLSAFARRFVYGDKSVKAEGPIFESAEQQGKELLVRFRVNAPLASRDGQMLRGFEVAGADGKYRRATVRIVDEKTLAVSEPTIAAPAFVKYGWDTPDEVNFFDADGRVAGAFASKLGGFIPPKTKRR